MPFPASGNPRQKFANGKLTNDGNNVAAYSSRYPANKKERECSAFIVPYCDIAVSRKREPSARICQRQIDERRQQCCRVLVTIPLPTKKREHLLCIYFVVLRYCRFPQAGTLGKNLPSARICPWQIDERRQQCCRVLVTIPLPTKKERAFCSLFFVGRGDAIRTRNLRFWRPLLYR